MGIFLAVLHARRCPDILAFWKDHSLQYPILSRMALDFLSVPVSGVGPENLFSVARDVCHYRRNRLSDHTIEAIMVQLCADRSVIDEEYQQLREEIDGIDDQLLSYDDDKDLDTLPEAGYISDEEDVVGDDEDVEEDYFRSTLDPELSFPSQPTTVARSLTPPHPQLRVSLRYQLQFRSLILKILSWNILPPTARATRDISYLLVIIGICIMAHRYNISFSVNGCYIQSDKITHG